MLSASVIILEYVCPTLGCIMGNVMFAAPLRAVRAAVGRGALGDLNPTPWAFMIGNCLGWIVYSILLQNYFIYLANAPGFLLSVYYSMCAVKLQYENHRALEMRRSFANFLESNRNGTTEQLNDENAWQRAKDLGKVVLEVTSQKTPAPAGHEKLVLGMVVIWLIVISIISFADFDATTRQLIVGIVVNCNLFFFYGSPLSTIFKVLSSRNSASIHIWTMVTNTLNGSFWTAYGVAVKDSFISIPNGIGALLGVIQFCLCILFPRRPTIADAGEEEVHSTVELNGFAVKEDTVEEGLSPSNSHESGLNGVVNQVTLETKECIENTSSSS